MTRRPHISTYAVFAFGGVAGCDYNQKTEGKEKFFHVAKIT
jgi:hypothetical protein